MSAEERRRLSSLHAAGILDTPRSRDFDRITQLAARHFGAPICAIGMLDRERQWFKSEVGLGIEETPRRAAFCQFTIQTLDTFVVTDAVTDARFRRNALRSKHGVRFYAGHPITLEPELPIGTLCIMDFSPRSFAPEELEDLKAFAHLAEERLKLDVARSSAAEHRLKYHQLHLELIDRTQSLEKQRRLFELAAAQAKLGAWEYDLNTGEVSWCNELDAILEFDPFFSRKRDDVLSKLQCPPWYSVELDDADSRRTSHSAEMEIATPSGTRKWLAVKSCIVDTDCGSLSRFGIATDITEAKLREESFKLLFQNNPIPMWVYEYSTQSFLAVNDAALQQYGYSSEQFLSMNLFDIRPVDEHERLRAALASATRSNQNRENWVHKTADGTRLSVSIYSRQILYQGKTCSLTAAIDVTEQRRQAETISYLAYHDVLTGLPNRRLLHLRLTELLETKSPLAVMIIDFDNFKLVNDSFGHEAGDRLIVSVAERLQAALSPDELLIRLGGDEFALIAENVFDGDGAVRVATEIINSFQQPFRFQGTQISISGSVGVTLAPQDGSDVDTLLRNADLALYKAKADGKSTYCFFEPQMHLRLVKRQALAQDLRRAITDGRFELHYQPIVALGNEATVGYEALLRWYHPERGNIPPADFIPIAEECGLISSLSDWVFSNACREALNLPPSCKIAINASAVQFSTGSILPLLRRVLAESGLSPCLVEVEITESVLLDHSARTVGLLHELRELGVSISLDDFGTGYSSLAYLQSLPIDKIKIDRSFVAGLESRRAREVLRAAISLGQNLDIVTLAEGVESEGQVRALKELGCLQAQGYFFGKPKPYASGFPGPSRTAALAS